MLDDFIRELVVKIRSEISPDVPFSALKFELSDGPVDGNDYILTVSVDPDWKSND